MMYQLTLFIKETDKTKLTKEFDSLVKKCGLKNYHIMVCDFEESGYRRSYLLDHGSLVVKTFDKDKITFVQFVVYDKKSMDRFKNDIYEYFDVIDPILKEYGYETRLQ